MIGFTVRQPLFGLPSVGTVPLLGGRGEVQPGPAASQLGAGLGAGEDGLRVLNEDLDDLVAEFDVEDGGDCLFFGPEGGGNTAMEYCQLDRSKVKKSIVTLWRACLRGENRRRQETENPRGDYEENARTLPVQFNQS